MKRVERFISIDGEQLEWETICNEYYDLIIQPGVGRYQTPLDRLEDLLDEFEGRPQLRIVQFLFNNFRQILLATPISLERIVRLFDNTNLSSLIYNANFQTLTYFGERLNWAFRYDDFRATKLVEISKRMNIKSCLYCNSQFTLLVTQNAQDIAKFQFDHFFPQSQYPYLSISLQNLIPVCANCNLSKRDVLYSLNEFSHPYHEDFHLLSEFKIDDLTFLRFHWGERVPEAEITLSLTNLDNLRVENYLNKLSLIGIYNRHKDIIQEIYLKAYAYINGGDDALLALVDPEGNAVFQNIEEIQQILLANYHLTEDINKRPLSKFMQDIARQAGLIN